MENVFFNYAQRYYEKKLLVTPIKPRTKAPALYAWQNPETYTDYESLVDQFKDAEYGIGLILGESTGIIAIDIDKEESLNLVPPSPVRKKGKKGETRFFRFNGEASKKRHDLGIELLSTGNQTILPPSTHPDGPSYLWVTPDTILDFDVSDLPILPEDFKRLLDVQSLQINVTKSDGSRCNHGSHTKLSDMLVAAINAGDDTETIVKTLLNYDSKINQEVSYFSCPSRNWKTKDRTLNAYTFVIQGYTRHLRIGSISEIPQAASKISVKFAPSIVEDTATINLDKPKEGLTRRPWPHLRGMGDIMFKHLAKHSRVRRSGYFFASIISTASVLLGNKVRMGKNWTNLYCMVVGNSGYGKTTALDFPKDVLPIDLIGVGMPSSDTGLIQNLPRQRTRIDVVDEGDNLFETVLSKNAYGKKMAATYAELFSSRGRVFKGKEIGSGFKDKNSNGNIGGCYSPCVSALVNMTTVGFNQYVTQSLIDSGFLARFLYFFDTEKKRQSYQSLSEEPPKEVKDFIEMWASKDGINLNSDPHYKFDVYDIPKTQEAETELRKAHETIEDIREKEPEDSKTYSLINRAMENLEKLAMIDCAFTNPNTKKLVMTPESIKWALEVTLVHIHNSRIHLGEFVNLGAKSVLMRKMIQFIKEKKLVTQSDITRKFQEENYRSIRKDVIDDLLESKTIVKVRVDGDTSTYYQAN